MKNQCILIILSIFISRFAFAINADIYALIQQEIITNLVNHGAISENVNKDNLSIEFTIKDKIPTCSDIQIILSGFEVTKPSNKFKATLKVRSSKGEILKTQIKGSYTELKDIVSLKTRIKSGHIISQGDLTTIKINSNKISSDVAIDVREVIGKTPKTVLSPNSYIELSNLKDPAVVKKGDIVNMIYSKGAVLLKTSGIAMDSGAKGDLIKVKNPRTNVILQSVIVDENKNVKVF